jgi:hypothetical protein
VKNLARVFCSSARTGKSVSAGNNPEKAVAAFPGCATGLSGLCGARSRLGTASPRVADILPMFDATCPRASGDLLGESLASTLENHPRYPSLRKKRDADLLATIDCLMEYRIRCIANLLPGLGFDGAGIALYRGAALSAFRIALPII